MPEEIVIVEQCPADDDSWRNNPDVQPKPKEPKLADTLAEFFAGLPKEARGAFLPVLGGFKAALELPAPDIEAIQESARNLAVPLELEEAKTALLAILEG